MQRATSDDVDDDEDDEGDGGDEDGASGASSSHGTKKWRIHISGLIRLRAQVLGQDWTASDLSKTDVHLCLRCSVNRLDMTAATVS